MTHLPISLNYSGKTSSDNDITTEPPACKKAREFEDFEDDDNVQSLPQDEVTTYLAMRFPRESTVSILQWWMAHAVELPNLAKVARQVLCVPASSAASERAFSAAGITISQRRTALDPENVDNILFLHSNLN
jgi:hypothetical protein